MAEKMSNENENKLVGAFVALLQAGANYLNARARHMDPTVPVPAAVVAPTSAPEPTAPPPAEPAAAKPKKAEKAAKEPAPEPVVEAPAAPEPEPAKPAKKKMVFCPSCGGKGETKETIVHADDCEEKPAVPAADAAPAEIRKENGKKMGGEEMMEEIKKLVLELAQKGSRDKVIEILKAFGVAKASDLPVAKHPEFITALRAAISKAGK